jgi:hypothetical protein
MGGMNPPDGLDLAQLLSAVVLVAVTCRYAEVVWRRKGRRRAETDRLASEASGRRGLERVRIFLNGSQTAFAATNHAQ